MDDNLYVEETPDDLLTRRLLLVKMHIIIEEH
jgi:hypothetical protein